MSALSELLAGAGVWEGTSTLQDPATHAPDPSTSTAQIQNVLDGRFARVDYTWSYRGAPQAGSLLIGDDRSGGVTACWIDSWHMGNGIMLLRGRDEGDSKLDLLGSYPAGDGSPDWGWRIAVTPKSAGASLHVVMHNIDPAGREYLAVDARYTLTASPAPRDLALHR